MKVFKKDPKKPRTLVDLASRVLKEAKQTKKQKQLEDKQVFPEKQKLRNKITISPIMSLNTSAPELTQLPQNQESVVETQFPAKSPDLESPEINTPAAKISTPGQSSNSDDVPTETFPIPVIEPSKINTEDNQSKSPRARSVLKIIENLEKEEEEKLQISFSNENFIPTDNNAGTSGKRILISTPKRIQQESQSQLVIAESPSPIAKKSPVKDRSAGNVLVQESPIGKTSSPKALPPLPPPMPGFQQQSEDFQKLNMQLQEMKTGNLALKK